jgi:hypothetical protein
MISLPPFPRREGLQLGLLHSLPPLGRRFSDFTDFETQLASAPTVKPDFAAAPSWREACNCDSVARTVADGYR